MENLGMGIMLGILGGNEETVTSIKSSLNKTIEKVDVILSDLLIFQFNSTLTD